MFETAVVEWVARRESWSSGDRRMGAILRERFEAAEITERGFVGSDLDSPTAVTVFHPFRSESLRNEDITPILSAAARLCERVTDGK
jgi:hypothetical protein